MAEQNSESQEDAPPRENVVLGAGKKQETRAGPVDRADPEAVWRILGLIGFVLALVGMVDVLLNLYPPAFGSPEWEFGTVTKMLTSLSLPTVGFAGLAAWAFALAGRKSRIALAAALFAVTALIAALFVLFLLNMPLAWSATEGPQGPAIIRSIIRTSVMAIGFGTVYLMIGISLTRTLTPRTTR